jgi:hypothetical protein
MQSIITAIEELIYSKKSQIRYLNEEMDRISRQLGKETDEIRRLEWELVEIKKIGRISEGKTMGELK